MKEKNFASFAQEVSVNARILNNNPFADCIRSACSEWLQLLLVTERIKQDAEGNATLVELAAVAQHVLDDRGIQEYYGESLHDWAMRTDTDWNPLVKPDARALFALDNLFDILDEDRKINGYFAKVLNHFNNNVEDNHNENKLKQILTSVVPDILDKNNFSWRNLNALRLSYPHRLLVKSTLFNDRLIDALENALHFCDDPTDFEELRESTIQKYIDNKARREGEFFKLNCNYLSRRADLVAEINQEIILAVAKKSVYLIRSLPVSIGIPAIISPPKFMMDVGNPEELTVDYGFLYGKQENREAIKIHIDFNNLLDAINSGWGHEFFRQLNDKIFCHAKDRLKVHDVRNHAETFPTWLLEALWNYKAWVENSTQILLHKTNQHYLAANIILRGVRFSHWIWLHPSTTKMSIEKRLNEYCRDAEMSHSTIKQSYEKVRGIAKKATVNLVFSQTEERLNIKNTLANGIQPPLNAELIEECRDLRNVLIKFIPADLAQSDDLNWVLNIAERIRARLHSIQDESSKHHKFTRRDILSWIDMDTQNCDSELDAFNDLGLTLNANDLALLLKKPLIR